MRISLNFLLPGAFVFATVVSALVPFLTTTSVANFVTEALAKNEINEKMKMIEAKVIERTMMPEMAIGFQMIRTPKVISAETCQKYALTVLHLTQPMRHISGGGFVTDDGMACLFIPALRSTLMFTNNTWETDPERNQSFPVLWSTVYDLTSNARVTEPVLAQRYFDAHSLTWVQMFKNNMTHLTKRWLPTMYFGPDHHNIHAMYGARDPVRKITWFSQVVLTDLREDMKALLTTRPDAQRLVITDEQNRLILSTYGDEYPTWGEYQFVNSTTYNDGLVYKAFSTLNKTPDMQMFEFDDEVYFFRNSTVSLGPGLTLKICHLSNSQIVLSRIHRNVLNNSFFCVGFAFLVFLLSLLLARATTQPLSSLTERMSQIRYLDFSGILSVEQPAFERVVKDGKEGKENKNNASNHSTNSILSFAQAVSPDVIINGMMGGQQGQNMKPQLSIQPIRHKATLKELKTMEEAFSIMATGLYHFSSFVPRGIVKGIVQGHKLSQGSLLKMQRAELTVMFSDIVNFTTISESMPIDTLILLLQKYFTIMASAISDSEGTIDKYIGDGCMAFWNHPDPVENHADKAVKTVLKIRKNIQLVPMLRLFRTRFGMHTGNVLVGTMGCSARISYTALGDAVDIASKLESSAKHYFTDILVTSQVIEQTQGVCWRNFGRISINGRQHIADICSVEDFEGDGPCDLPMACILFNEGMKCFLNRCFLEARQKFLAFLALRGADSMADHLLLLCDEYASDPPPEDWTGINLAEGK